MSLEDQRYYEVLYGFYPNHWAFNFGLFSAHHYMLDRDYIDSSCDTTDSTLASTTVYFLYPFYAKKIYFVEGVIKGFVVYEASGGATTVTSYRVTLCKMGSDNSDEELVSTGHIVVNKALVWNAGLGIGDSVCLPFWIDCWEEKKIEDEERLYVKVEAVCTNVNCVLLHGNDSSLPDFKIEIPIRG
jgi:hypothetical protein